MLQWRPARKHVFDTLAAGALLLFLLPTLLLCALGILILEGRPILYVSRRRVYREHSALVPKCLSGNILSNC